MDKKDIIIKIRKLENTYGNIINYNITDSVEELQYKYYLEKRKMEEQQYIKQQKDYTFLFLYGMNYINNKYNINLPDAPPDEN